MSKDRHAASEPELSTSEGNQALLDAVEDRGEARGRGQDQLATDRVLGKQQARLAADRRPRASDGLTPATQLQAMDTARKRRLWLFISGTLGLAAAAMLLFNLQARPQEPDAIEPRGSASGFAAEIKVVDEPIAGAPAGIPHHVKVNVTANSDGFIALFRQSGDGEPAIVSNLEYKKDQGSMHVLQENAASGTRYCIIGAGDQEGMKHLFELILDLWAYLPTTACYSVR